jgi:putative addiction module component (TIGR02574 family)
MSETAKKLLEQILTLSEDDRVAITDAVWKSLGEESQDELWAGNGPTIDPEFRAELERRMDEAEKHPESLLSWEQVKAELEARYGKASDE